MGVDKNDFAFWLEEESPDGNWYALFEDNGEVAYLYLGKTAKEGAERKIHDDLWTYNMIYPPIHECKEVFLLWSKDSTKAALIVDQECWGLYDLASWRKMNAPRIENRIEPIPFEVWENGIKETEGSPIKNLN